MLYWMHKLHPLYSQSAMNLCEIPNYNYNDVITAI